MVVWSLPSPTYRDRPRPPTVGQHRPNSADHHHAHQDLREVTEEEEEAGDMADEEEEEAMVVVVVDMVVEVAQ